MEKHNSSFDFEAKTNYKNILQNVIRMRRKFVQKADKGSEKKKKTEFLDENGEPLDNLYKHFGSITIKCIYSLFVNEHNKMLPFFLVLLHFCLRFVFPRLLFDDLH